MAERRTAPFLAALELLVPSVCPGCDAPRRSRQPLLCASCHDGLQPQFWTENATCSLRYCNTGRTLIRRLKFDGRRDRLPVLVKVLARRARTRARAIVVPIPRQPERIREFGADPVLLLDDVVTTRVTLGAAGAASVTPLALAPTTPDRRGSKYAITASQRRPKWQTASCSRKRSR